MNGGAGGGLLEPRFLAELEAYRRRFRFPVRSGASGDRGGRRGGSSAEFLEHRVYSAGDDARRIDWAAYARTHNTVIKRFRAEEDAWVRLMIDCSGSMAFGEPTKHRRAQELAAALGHLALAQGERVDVTVGHEDRPRSSAMLRGGRALGSLCRSLEASSPRGAARLGSLLGAHTRRAGARTVLVVVSDFLGEDDAEVVFRQAAARGHVLYLLQVLTPEEADPRLLGDYLLEDAETGESLPFTADDQSLAQYRHRLQALQDRLRDAAVAAGGRFVATTTAEPLAVTLPRLLGEHG